MYTSVNPLGIPAPEIQDKVHKKNKKKKTSHILRCKNETQI